MKKREVCSHFLYLQTRARALKFPGRHVQPIKSPAHTPSAVQYSQRILFLMHDRFHHLHTVPSHLYRRSLPMPTVEASVTV